MICSFLVILSLVNAKCKILRKVPQKILPKLEASMPTVFHVCIQDSDFVAEGCFCSSLKASQRVFFLNLPWSKLPWRLPGSSYSKDSSGCFHSLSPWWSFLEVPLICEGYCNSFLLVKICLHGVCSQINLPWDISPWSTCLGSWWSLIILPHNQEKEKNSN